MAFNKLKKYKLSRARKDLPRRKLTDNKTRGGKCLIVAGSRGFWGAAVLCGEAAARVGAGYVYILDSKTQFPLMKSPDFLTIKKVNDFNIFHSIAVGPGYVLPRTLISLIKKLIQRKYPSVVLDAEALNALATVPKLRLPSSWILTPHEGELARLLKVPSAKIKSDRVKYVLLAQKKFGCVVLLKGFRSLVATNSGIYEIQSGNCSLAKAGTGDVLTGMIAGFLSQKLQPDRATMLAAFVHGFIADQWIQNGFDHLSLRAPDLISAIPQTLNYIRTAKAK